MCAFYKCKNLTLQLDLLRALLFLVCCALYVVQFVVFILYLSSLAIRICQNYFACALQSKMRL